MMKHLIYGFKIEIDTADINGDTVLQKACQELQLGKVKLLVDLGADVNSKNRFGVSTLESSMLVQFVTDCFKWVLKRSCIDNVLQVFHRVVSDKRYWYVKTILLLFGCRAF
ncbi:hypothetical protein QAD02_000749 [Eretmocerus hayati]|uniref:Uncharacterized protein n=1 Tax=Eretmocerus hayati TaxID=131215 RepID=A0ACC2NE63_9HYME|nr:hypothetical protein QAD02_000749 [Eretmocerus hayati]